ncbi:HNH endonuclease [Alphaproteobacteria bacterium]|nr:HNH endonuclease [Alphaproteobacteria bacterium]
MPKNELKSLSYQGLVNYETEVKAERARLIAENATKGSVNLKSFEIKKQFDEKTKQEIARLEKSKAPISREISNLPINKIKGYLSLACVVFLFFLYGGIPVIYYYHFPYDLHWGLDVFICLAAVGFCIQALEFISELNLIKLPNQTVPFQLMEKKKAKDTEITRWREKREKEEKTLLRKLKKEKERFATIKTRLIEIQSELDMFPKLKKRAKERERTATIAAFSDEARTGTSTIRADLIREVGRHWSCPYCGTTGDVDQAHADHIHPVSKGGRTVPQNMVLVCQPCNTAKSDKTLRTFIRIKQWNFDEICDHLESMGKDI